LTAGADVQEDEVYVSVRAWGDQRTSWLVDWWIFPRAPDDEGIRRYVKRLLGGGASAAVRAMRSHATERA
jgi:phage terminase large subunit GpA-like protein